MVAIDSEYFSYIFGFDWLLTGIRNIRIGKHWLSHTYCKRENLDVKYSTELITFDMRFKINTELKEEIRSFAFCHSSWL